MVGGRPVIILIFGSIQVHTGSICFCMYVQNCPPTTHTTVDQVQSHSHIQSTVLTGDPVVSAYWKEIENEGTTENRIIESVEFNNVYV